MKLTLKLCEDAVARPKVYRLSDGNSLYLGFTLKDTATGECATNIVI